MKPTEPRLVYVSPFLAKPLRSKLAVALQLTRWSEQARLAAELAEGSGNLPAATELLSRAVEYARRAAILTDQIQLAQYEALMSEGVS